MQTIKTRLPEGPRIEQLAQFWSVGNHVCPCVPRTGRAAIAAVHLVKASWYGGKLQDPAVRGRVQGQAEAIYRVLRIGAGDVLGPVAKTVAIRIPIPSINAGGTEWVQPVGSFPPIGQTVAIAVGDVGRSRGRWAGKPVERFVAKAAERGALQGMAGTRRGP